MNTPCHCDKDCGRNDSDDDEDPGVALVPRRRGHRRGGDALEDSQTIVRAAHGVEPLQFRPGYETSVRPDNPEWIQ